MRAASAAALALLVAVAGCAGAPTGTAPGTTPSPDSSPTLNASGDSVVTTLSIAPSALTAERAKQAALEREKAYLTARLRNATDLDSYTVGCCMVGPEATVVERTADGFRVEVTYPYTYTKIRSQGTTTVRVIADAASSAVYVVRAANGTVVVRRVSGSEVV